MRGSRKNVESFVDRAVSELDFHNIDVQRPRCASGVNVKDGALFEGM